MASWWTVLVFIVVTTGISAQNLIRIHLTENGPSSTYITTNYVATITASSLYIDYHVVFDTSSCNVLFMSEECVTGSCNCVNLVKYQNPQNVTKESKTVRYFDTGSATGRAAQGTVQVSSLNTLPQDVIVADEINFELCRANADASFGMAPPDCQNPFNLTPFFANIANRKNFAQVFSVHHSRNKTGEIIFGGTIEKYAADNFTYVPIAESGTWKFKLNALKINDVNIVEDDTLAFIDTSKAVVIGPRAQVTKLNKLIGCTPVRRGSQEICEIDCMKIGSLPDVVFFIGSKSFNMSSKNYIRQKGNVCYSGFLPSDNSYYQMGDLFIDQYYIEFDWSKRRVGIARSEDGD